jgi:hypothetical protein
MDSIISLDDQFGLCSRDSDVSEGAFIRRNSAAEKTSKVIRYASPVVLQ